MSLKQGKLLVVDDDENNRDMLSRRLVRQGYEVEIAEDGSRALEKINEAQYDLILLDQMMPGMSGLDLLHLLRATHSPSDLPVIMVTAMDQSQTVVDALNGGANDYVTKPVDMPVVSARIDAQLTRSRAERTVRESEQRHALAARSGSDGFWDLNLVSGEVFVAPGWMKLLGYEQDEFSTGQDSWLRLVHPDDAEAVKRSLSFSIENPPQEFHSEFRMRNKNGKYRWVLARGSTLKSQEMTLRIGGSFTDLTAVKFSDPLTGLENRPMLIERLGEMLASEPPNSFALALFDLDRFKLLNDSHGAAVGDKILLAVAGLMRKAVAESKFLGAPVSRIDGDEFTVLLKGIESVGQITAFAEQVLNRVNRPIPVDGVEFTIQASAGVATGSERPEDLLRNAELAMHQAKELGRNRCQVFDPAIRTRVASRLELARDLRFAVEGKQLVALYQAKVNITSRRVVGFEALLRWNHPQRGMVSPVEFIPLAEESGLIVPIGAWILREAAGQLAKWQAGSPLAGALTMNVNLSVQQLADPDLVPRIQSILRETGIPPHSLKLELTESSLMTDVESARVVLSELQEMGIGLKLDDFGTGYSSLSYLRALHFESLKIDRSFIAKLTVDKETNTIVDTIIKLAHALDMTVVAEGIEEKEQFDELERLGCDVAQGFYFSRPVTAEAAERLWTSNPFE